MTYREYLESIHTEQTAKSYVRVYEHFSAHCKKGDKASYENIIDYLSHFKFKEGYAIAGIKRYFDYLLEIGERKDHPCRHLVIKRQRTPLQFQDLFKQEELEELLNRENRYSDLGDRNKVILSLLIYQGLTPANIARLRMEDLKLMEGEVYIRATREVSRRTLQLKPNQILLLHSYINSSRTSLKRKDTNALFISKLGAPLSVDTLNRMIRPLKKLFPRRNLNARTIRQSVITNWLNEDRIPLEDVQIMSGQKWMSSTEKYMKPNTEERRDIINSFSPF